MRPTTELVFSTERFGIVLPDAGFFTWDLPENLLFADNALAALFGIDATKAEHGLPIEMYLARVHSRDRPALAKAIRDSIIAHQPQQQRYRVRNADENYVTVMCYGRSFRNAVGEPIKYVGIVVPAENIEDGRRALSH